MSENFGRKGMLQVLSPVCTLFFPSSLSYPPLFSFAHPCPIGNRRTVRRIFERYRDNGRLEKKLASKEKIFLFFNPLLPRFSSLATKLCNQSLFLARRRAARSD